MPQPLPIVLIHKDNSDYLPLSLTQVVATNPGNEVYLIGNNKTRHFNGLLKHRRLNDYFKTAAEFAPLFTNLSSNGHDYELFCIQRWFVLHEFMRQNNWERCIYIDSDILPYVSLSDVQPETLQWGLTVLVKSPHTNFINNSNLLEAFCGFVTYHYATAEGKALLQQYYKEHTDIHGQVGGISDMTFFMKFREKYPDQVGDLSVPRNGAVYDITIDTPQGFITENGYKKIERRGNIPYGTRTADGNTIRFNTLHFQGKSKKLMPLFVWPMPFGRKLRILYLQAMFTAQRIEAKLKKL